MIVIDYSDKRPIYEQIVEKFKMLILNGVLEMDDKMPSVRNLAIELSINPNTIQRAYTELEHLGLIYSVKGKGNFVSANKRVVAQEKEKILFALKEDAKKCINAGITFQEIEVLLKDMYKEVTDL